MGSHFCENDKILKEKEAEIDLFVHQPPRGGNRFTSTEHLKFFILLYTLYIVILFYWLNRAIGLSISWIVIIISFYPFINKS